MRKLLLPFIALALSAQSALADQPRVWIETDRGPILIELDPERAPDQVENFLAYVNSGFYDDLIFHRSLPGFVVQGGGYDREFNRRQPTRGAVRGAPDNGLLNTRGSIAMAQIGSDIDSAREQFFFNLDDNDFLDQDFTVFGRIVSGLQIIENINAERSISKQVGLNVLNDVPVRPPLIRKAVETTGFPIMPLHTGSWFDPATNGTGFNIEIGNDASSEDGPLVLVYWYDFREGRQIWVTGAEPFAFGASEITVELISVDEPGGEVGFRNPPAFDAFEVWGSLTIRFDDCRNGLFTYDSVELGRGDIEVTRLTLPNQASCNLLD